MPSRQLILGERSGSYPGMPEQREFDLILHDEEPPWASAGPEHRRGLVMTAGSSL